MKNAKAVLSVKFNSTFSPEHLSNVCQEDVDIFRSVPGLLQKYYLTEVSTGSISGFYIFETRAHRANFWSSEVAENLPARYGIIAETLRVEQYDVAIVLNDAVLV